MAHNFTVARPYARAVFTAAIDAGQLHGWQKLLQALALIVQDDQLCRLIEDPTVSQHQLIELISCVVKDLLANELAAVNDSFANFIKLLATENRLSLLPDISTLYHAFLAEQESRIEVEVISAYPLEKQRKSDLQTALEKRFASKVSVDYSEDKSLIGGALIRTGNWIMDGTIRGKLQRLKYTLRG